MVRYQILLTPVAKPYMPSNRLIALINNANQRTVATNQEIHPNCNSNKPGKWITSTQTQENHQATQATIICIANLTRAGIEYFGSIKYQNSSIMATTAIIAHHKKSHRNSRQ